MFGSEEWCGKSREELARQHMRKMRAAAKARRDVERAALAESRKNLAEPRGRSLEVFEICGRSAYVGPGSVSLPLFSILISK